MTRQLRPRRLVWLLALFEASLGLVAWVLGWLLGQPPLERFSWSPHDALIACAASVPLLALFLMILHLPWRPAAKIREVIDETLTPLFHSSSWIELLAVSVAAGIGEEMLFR